MFARESKRKPQNARFATKRPQCGLCARVTFLCVVCGALLLITRSRSRSRPESPRELQQDWCLRQDGAPLAEPAHYNTWITGLPRSGTDWVGLVLGTVAAAIAGDGAAMTLGNSSLFLREPFNVDCTRPCGKTNITEVKVLREGFVGHFPWIGELGEDAAADGNAVSRANVYGRAIDGLLGHCGVSLPPRGIVMKDPIGFYASPWVARRYDCRVLVTVRNPFSWVASMLKARFSIDCGIAGLCSEKLLLERLSRENILQLREAAACPGGAATAADGGLAAAADDAGRIVAAAAASEVHIDALFAAYAMFMATARLFRAQHPSWTFVRWEDLVVAPTREWERAVGPQALDASAGRGRAALANVLLETTGGASPGNNKFSTRRDPWGELFDWQGSLPWEHVAPIISHLRKVAEPFYPEPYWWELDAGSGSRNGGGGFAARGQPLFQEVSTEASLAAHPGPGMGFAWGDADGDGFLDLFLGYHFDAVYRPDAEEDPEVAAARGGGGGGSVEAYPEPTLFLNDNACWSAAAGRTFRARKISEFSDVPTERCHESPCLQMSIPADYHGASFVDFDGDGDDDLVVATGGGAGQGHSPHLALRNDGDGRFTYLQGAFADDGGSGGSGAGISGGDSAFALSELQRGRFSHWGDWDGDGLLDVVIYGDRRPEPPMDSMVFVQRRGAAETTAAPAQGVFTMVNDNPMKLRIKSRIGPRARHAGMLVIHGGDPAGSTPVVASANNAGSVAGGMAQNSSFRLSLPRVSIDDDPCIVSCFAWYSGHGKYCCVYASAFDTTAVASGGTETQGRLRAALAGLAEAVVEARPSKIHLVSCALAEDFDNDGDVDLFVVFFHSIRELGADAVAELAGTTVYFENEGDASNGYNRPVSFRRVERPVLFEGYTHDVAHNPDCCAAVDYDNDGRMDVFLTTSPFLWYLHGSESFAQAREAGTFDPKYWKYASGPPVLLRNRQEAGHWLKVVPVGDGVSVPRQPIGTRVTISAEGGGGGLRSEQTQTLTDGVLVFAQGDRRLHFGLGGSAAVDSITVTWPDGRRDVLLPERVDCLVRVVRGATGVAAELLYDDVT